MNKMMMMMLMRDPLVKVNQVDLGRESVWGNPYSARRMQERMRAKVSYEPATV